MKKNIVAWGIFFSASVASASNLQNFLKQCAYGTLIGAGVGVISLAMTDKPSENTANIAKGASLGLYGGIAYGLYKLNEPVPAASTTVDPFASVVPVFDQGQLDGAQLTVQIYQF